MNKLILIFAYYLITCSTANAQQAVAKLKFEEAEQAYSTSNFQTALNKLTDVEVLLKTTNPKILHLKILASVKIIEQNPDDNFAIIENTRKMAADYLKNYENIPENDDKYAEIYKASEKLNKYPESRAAFDKRIATIRAAKQAEIDKSESSRRVVANNRMMAFTLFNDLSREFKFQLGTTQEQLLAQNPDILDGMSRHKSNGGLLYWQRGYVNSRKPKLGPYVIQFDGKGVLISYEIVIALAKSGEAGAVFSKYLGRFLAISPEYLKDTYDGMSVNLPDSNNSLTLKKLYNGDVSIRFIGLSY